MQMSGAVEVATTTTDDFRPLARLAVVPELPPGLLRGASSRPLTLQVRQLSSPGRPTPKLEVATGRDSKLSGTCLCQHVSFWGYFPCYCPWTASPRRAGTPGHGAPGGHGYLSVCGRGMDEQGRLPARSTDTDCVGQLTLAASS